MNFNGIQSLMAMFNGAPVTCKYNGVDVSTGTAPAEPTVIYGVKIATTVTSSSTALTYIDDAIGFTGARGNSGTFSYGSWQDKFPFNKVKPCLYLNGAVNYYLNPLDYKLKVDGSAADITSGIDGDVMIEFPKIWWKFETIGTDLYVRYSNSQVDETYKCLAHMRGTTEKDFVYMSAYVGGTVNAQLSSLSGVLPVVSMYIGDARILAKTGDRINVDMVGYYQMFMLQILYLIMFKDRNSQTALGRGYGISTNTVKANTGGANTRGLFYGETTGKFQNKFCGIEDFFGNVQTWADGFMCTETRHILIGNENFSNEGTGYTDFGQFGTADILGQLSQVQGTTDLGFLAKTCTGTTSTYYCDYAALKISSYVYYGAAYNSSSLTGGIFESFSGFKSFNNNSSLGARLMAL